jgi:hypothetical protein
LSVAPTFRVSATHRAAPGSSGSNKMSRRLRGGTNLLEQRQLFAGDVPDPSEAGQVTTWPSETLYEAVTNGPACDRCPPTRAGTGTATTARIANARISLRAIRHPLAPTLTFNPSDGPTGRFMRRFPNPNPPLRAIAGRLRRGLTAEAGST